jgi:hypothetical protein
MDAIQYSVYIKYCTLYHIIGGKSLIKIFNNKVLATILKEHKAFRRFSEVVYIYQLSKKDKLVPWNKKAIIIGYIASLKTYRVYMELK